MMIKLLFFFQGFSIWFKTLLRALSNNIISIFFIVFVYLALWHFPQTVDLLLILNQADAFLLEVPLYFSLLLVAAFLIWNAPKYFYYHNYKDISISNLIGFIPNQHYKFQDRSKTAGYPYIMRIHMRKVLPRMLAVLLLVISALSILNAMELFGLENTYTKFLNPTNTLILVIFLLLLLSEPHVYKVLKGFLIRSSKATLFLFAVSVGLVLLIISLGTLNTQAEKDLGNLFISNCALALLFTLLSFNSYKVLKDFSKKLFYGTILMAGLVLLAIFLGLNFYPDLSSGINPLSILILSLLSLFMICFILILVGKKIKLPLLSIVAVFFVFSARFFSDTSDHYQLSLEETSVNRPPLETYIYHWLKSREEVIKKTDAKFPILLVSSEGGGSRAGLWSFLVHSYLYEKSKGAYFENNLLSLTGASGGSVGNAMFFAEAQTAYLANKKSNFRITNDEHPDITYKASAIYKENYLSAALLSLLGRDLFKEVTSLFHFRNRGQLLEEQWIKTHELHFYDTQKQSVLDKEFLSFYKNYADPDTKDFNRPIPPLLLINTTHTQTGNYNIISPVKYTHLRPLTGMNDFIDNVQSSYPNTSITLATAMRINASFPFVTPVGEIRNVTAIDGLESDQYADAGYYDNIGGRVSKGIEEVLTTVLQDSFPYLEEKIAIKHLIISNEEEGQMTRTQTQFAAPLTTLKNVRNGHTQEIKKRLGGDHTITLKRTEITSVSNSLFMDDNEAAALTIKPVLPLGRYLSKIAIRSMEARLTIVRKELDEVLE